MSQAMQIDKDPEITVLGGRVRLAQMHDGFRTSIDSILLAAACPAKNTDHILDLGCGVGSAGLCVLSRLKDAQLTGIDIQEDHIALALENSVLNGFDNRATFKTASVLNFGNPEAKDESRFDHVICNPPYFEAGTHLVSPKEKKATALGHCSSDICLKDWLDAAHRNLKSEGSLTIIHRAGQTDTIIRGMGKRFGAIEIIPLWPKAGCPAKRVIIRALKNRRSPSYIHPGITLHQADGSYTPEAEKILRSGAPLA